MSSPVEIIYNYLKGPVKNTFSKLPSTETKGKKSGLQITAVTTATGAICGNNWIIFELLIKQKPTSFRNGMLRYAAHVIPYAGMGLAFGITYSMARELRQKDDPINMTLATAAASCVIYAKYSAPAAASAFAVFGTVGTFIKWLDVNGYDWLGKNAPYYKDFGGFNRVVIGPRTEIKEPTNY